MKIQPSKKLYDILEEAYHEEEARRVPAAHHEMRKLDTTHSWKEGDACFGTEVLARRARKVGGSCEGDQFD